MDIRAYNRRAWDRCVDKGDPWTIPVSSEIIAAARRGEWQIVLTPRKPVPRAWFPDLKSLDVLCLASGGGQQAPILAATGASVTLLDNSPKQLAQDRLVADREGLELTLVEGDMRDLRGFADESFDLIFHPCSNCFIEEVRPVWREASRVIRQGGALLSGFSHPIVFCFDPELEKQGVLQVKYQIPYSDLKSLTDEERRRYTDAGEPLCFGHSLEDQIGGQLDAGFTLTGYYDDFSVEAQLLARFMPGYGATRAIKP
jgi:SAM-dependent methyltransferase